MDSDQLSSATDSCGGFTRMAMRGLRLPSEDECDQEFTSQFLSNFTPLKILGHGGFGCVFEAERHLENVVKWKCAVKRIPIRGRGKELTDALREVEALIDFDHRRIVKFHDAWKEEPPRGWQSKADEDLLKKLKSNEQFSYAPDCAFLYIQMELCQSTLAEWLSVNTSRPKAKMLMWFSQIVDAVAYIHDRGKIHRDLKPSNILLANEYDVKICDLGILATREIIEHNGDNQEISDMRTFDRGTWLYMAPEQKGSLYSSKVDVFALGLILAELCVVMEPDEMERIFNDYRRGKGIESLREQIGINYSLTDINVCEEFPELDTIVEWLTQLNEGNRPDCKAILDHSFLGYENSAFRYKKVVLDLNSEKCEFDVQDIVENIGADGKFHVQMTLNKSTLQSKWKQQSPSHILERYGKYRALLSRTCAEFSSDFLTNFKPTRLIGQGQFGCVFEAVKQVDNTKWMSAVKRIPMSRSGYSAADALKKVETMFAFYHPGLVRLFDAWIEVPPVNWQQSADDALLKEFESTEKLAYAPDSAFIYIQMELCTSSLAEWLRKNQTRDLGMMKHWFVQVVSAVEFLHNHEIVHGNLKPTNIFFAGNSVKVGDVSIAAATITQTIEIKNYAAPEQGGINDSKKVDIFALGLILAEMCLVMNDEETASLFNNYRCGNTSSSVLFQMIMNTYVHGMHNNVLKEFTELEDFVGWLANFDASNRPSCFYIRNHFQGQYSLDNKRMPTKMIRRTDKSCDFAILKNFEIRGTLGQGAFGCVFEALKQEDKCLYAVKRVTVQKSAYEKTWRRIQVIKKLKHEGIVRYFDVFDSRAPVHLRRKFDEDYLQKFGIKQMFDYPPNSMCIFFSMEFCPYTLEDWLVANDTRDMDTTKTWFSSLVSAVAFIHSKGLIHRDLKPSNILFNLHHQIKIGKLEGCADIVYDREHQFSGRKIGEIVGRLHAKLTNNLSMIEVEGEHIPDIGTPMYMAPEQRSLKYTSKVDIFSLGLILTELCVVLTGGNKIEVFENMRCGILTDILRDNSDAAIIVSWMTKPNSSDRPTAERILRYDFLASHNRVASIAVPNKSPSESENASSSHVEKDSTHSTAESFSSQFHSQYKPVRLIGQGRFGCVFEVDENNNERYAVKRIQKRRNPKEAIPASMVMSTMGMDHPGVLTLGGLWCETPSAGWQKAAEEKLMADLNCKENLRCLPNSALIYVKMELCQSSLEQWLSENKERNRDIGRMQFWFKQIVEALNYLHGIGIVHRNLKPSNILFADENVLKLSDIDFETRDGYLYGDKYVNHFPAPQTKQYTSPEHHIRGLGSLNKVDIFALGLIIAEMCVVMTEKDAIHIFNTIRELPSSKWFKDLHNPLTRLILCNYDNNALREFPELEKLVNLLTNKYAMGRPNCDSILEQFNRVYALEDAPNPSRLIRKEPPDCERSIFEEKFVFPRGGAVLGQGAYGCVFEAIEAYNGNLVAIKRIPLKESELEKLYQRIAGLQNLRHDGIVRVMCVWEERPSYRAQQNFNNNVLPALGLKKMFALPESIFFFLQMEFCPYTLEDWLVANEARDVAQAKLWFKQLVSAVAFIHSKGYIHRDLKPSNILFDLNHRIKIGGVDNLAEIVRNTEDNSMHAQMETASLPEEIDAERTTDIGTSMYMAPEQRHWNYSSKVDIFSLGLILAELCAVLSGAKEMKAFEAFRSGTATDILDDFPEAAHLVPWMTRINSSERPTATEVLKHKFLGVE